MSDKLEAILPDIAPAKYSIRGREFVLEEMCAFKVAQILKAVSKFSQDIQLTELVAPLLALQDGGGNLVGVASEFLPRLLATAPDALVSLLALAVIPNAELETLSETPGAIDKRIAEETRFFQFKATPAQVAELAALCVPLIGLDALKKAVPALGQRVMDSLGVQAQLASAN